MIKRSFINSLPSQLKFLILDDDVRNSKLLNNSTELDGSKIEISSMTESTNLPVPTNSSTGDIEDNISEASSFSDDANSIQSIGSVYSFDTSILNIIPNLDDRAKFFLIEKLLDQKGIIFTEFNNIKLKLFDVDSTLNPYEFDKLVTKLDPKSRIMLCEKIKLIYGFNSLISFIIRLINLLNFSTFFSIFDITSNIKLYGFYSLNYNNPVEILIKQIRKDLFIVKSFKEFTIQEMKKEHDFHLPYKEFKRLNLNNGNLVVVKILFKNEQKSIDLSLIKPFLSKIKMLHLSLENESKLKPFNDLIDQHGSNLNYLKFGVNRGTFKKIPIKNNINTLKLVNIDNLNFINDLKECSSLDVFFDNWELRNNCDIKFQSNFIINFEMNQKIQNLKTLNIFHTYIDSKDLNKLKYFPNLTHSKISYVILDDNGFDLRGCENLQELKIHFTYQRLLDDLSEDNGDNEEDGLSKYSDRIYWSQNLKKLSITIHNIKNLIQNFSIRLNILKKIAKPLPPSIIDLCIDISYDTGGSGPELYSISRDDILKISNLINNILTENLENLKLKGISRYNYKIGKPLIFSAINFPKSLKLLSLNDFILDYNFLDLPNLKRLYFEHSLFDFNFKLPNSDEILIEKCTFKDLSYVPPMSSKIEFKMCTFRKVPSYNGDVSNIVINNCRVMEQPTNNTYQFQQQLQAKNNSGNNLPNQRRKDKRFNDNTQQSHFLPQPQQPLMSIQKMHQIPQPTPATASAPFIINDYQNPYSSLYQISNFNNASSTGTPVQPFTSPNPVNNFLTQDLEFQLGNLSLNSSFDPLQPSNVNLPTSSASSTVAMPNSPPLSSTDSLGIHAMQKRADSFHAFSQHQQSQQQQPQPQPPVTHSQFLNRSVTLNTFELDHHQHQQQQAQQQHTSYYESPLMSPLYPTQASSQSTTRPNSQYLINPILNTIGLPNLDLFNNLNSNNDSSSASSSSHPYMEKSSFGI